MPKKSPNPALEKRRVLLLGAQTLLSEGLRAILGVLNDIEVIGPLALEACALGRLPESAPDIVLIAEEGGGSQGVICLAGQILERYPDVPLIHVGLEQEVVRLYISQTLPARSSELIAAIRRFPAGIRREVHLIQPEDSRGAQTHSPSS